jgi:excisionase family DNA binding protein
LNTPTDKYLLTVEEAAELLALGRTTVYALIRSGDLNSVQVGRLRRVRPSDLAAFAESLATVPTPAAA